MDVIFPLYLYTYILRKLRVSYTTNGIGSIRLAKANMTFYNEGIRIGLYEAESIANTMTDRHLNILLLECCLRQIKETHCRRAEIYPHLLKSLSTHERDALTAYPSIEQRRRISQIISYAKNRGLIIEKPDHTLELTQKGLKRLRTYTLRSLEVPPQEWDRKWRIVLYDVPETKRDARVQMNHKLQQLGFYMYQRSVWIFPFECRDTVRYLASSFDIQPYITFIEASSIDHEDKLRLHFKELLSNNNSY